ASFLDHAIRLWDIGSGMQLGAFVFQPVGRFFGVYQLTYSSDGRRLISDGPDGTIQIWDTATRSPGAVYKKPGCLLRNFAVSQDGLFLAAIDNQNMETKGIYIWNTRTGKELPSVKVRAQSYFTHLSFRGSN